jgi:hypothetical protein
MVLISDGFIHPAHWYFEQVHIFLTSFFPQPLGEGPLLDKPNYVTLLKSFSSLLRPMGLMLTSEGTINKAIIAKGCELTK